MTAAVNITIPVDLATVRAAIESARVGYWAKIEGGCIQETDEPNRWKRWPLSQKDIARALVLMATKGHPKTLGRFINGDADADSGDVLIQYAVLGEVVYG